MAVSDIFQKRLTKLVSDSDLNKTELAKEINISSASFSKAYLYGIISQLGTLTKIADYFDVSLEFLLGNTENPDFVASEKDESFFQRLEQLREEKGIASIYELSQLTHIHRNNMAQWKKRGYTPNIEDVQLLADFFEVSVDYLLGRTDERKIF